MKSYHEELIFHWLKALDAELILREGICRLNKKLTREIKRDA